MAVFPQRIGDERTAFQPGNLQMLPIALYRVGRYPCLTLLGECFRQSLIQVLYNGSLCTVIAVDACPYGRADEQQEQDDGRDRFHRLLIMFLQIYTKKLDEMPGGKKYESSGIWSDEVCLVS